MKESYDEHALVRGLKANDDRAQKDFVKLFSGYLFAFAMKKGLAREEDALEVVNDTVYKVIKNIHIFDPNRKTKFSTWVTQIAKNTIIDKQRKLSKTPVMESLESLKEKEFVYQKNDYQDSDHSDGKNVYNAYENHNCSNTGRDVVTLSRTIMQEALKLISESDREIFLQRAYDQPFKNIALSMGKTENAVKVAHNRARPKLKKAYITVLETQESQEQKEAVKTYLQIGVTK